jgi:hypothetical protein
LRIGKPARALDVDIGVGTPDPTTVAASFPWRALVRLAYAFPKKIKKASRSGCRGRAATALDFGISLNRRLGK